MLPVSSSVQIIDVFPNVGCVTLMTTVVMVLMNRVVHMVGTSGCCNNHTSFDGKQVCIHLIDRTGMKFGKSFVSQAI